MIKNQGAMGRNPFGKQKNPKNTQFNRIVSDQKRKSTQSIDRLHPKLADWLFIALPAHSYVLGLKTVLLALR